jgi:ubiquinone/menaquinone biosynthesis C-methylase UbiE
MRTLTPAEAKSYYDHFGAKQDSQSFYEAPAHQALVANSHFEQAASVFEFGCGTGAFALELLTKYLPSTAQYLGIDISTTMIQLAASLLKPFSQRATVTLISEGNDLHLSNNSIDRFVSSYVLDLLPQESVAKVLDGAHLALRPNGLLCLASLTKGITPISRFTMGVWQRIFTMNPSWVGGCRPTELMDHLRTDRWQVHFKTVIVAWGIPSEVVVASPIKAG